MPLSASDKVMLERIEWDFTYHPPTPARVECYERMRHRAKSLAIEIVEFCPESRERALALTKLEETVMWANAAIARAAE